MNSLIDELKKNISCEVAPTETLDSYATDESIFKITPTAVVFPASEADVRAIVQIADAHGVPITSRGGGTGIAGQSIGSGIILDFSKHMNRILHLSVDHAIVEPGVVLGELNRQACDLNSKFGPDPGSWDRCTIGGMIATNASGPHALIYGSTREHIRSLEVVLSNATFTSSKKLNEEMKNFTQEICKHENLIVHAKKNVEKNSSGYFLEALLEKPAAYEKLISGSEGTLAIVTQSTLDLVPLLTDTAFTVFSFDSMGRALMAVPALRNANASCIELLDRTMLEVIQKENSNLSREFSLENAKASLWVEWNTPIPFEWSQEIKFKTYNPDRIKSIWAERSKVSEWLHAQAENQNRKPLRCIEDACVPITALISYVIGVNDILERHDCKGTIFGHVGNGHLHINPMIRSDLPDLKRRVETLMDEFYELVIGLGGTISGEHGDGILRAKYAKKQWQEIWPLFQFVKKSFDPKNILNPGKKIPMEPMSFVDLKF